MQRILIVIAAALTVWCALPGAANASVGVSTDVKSIVIGEPIAAGGTYPLHGFAIVNSGSQPSGYEVLVSSVESSASTGVPAKWLTFDPPTFYLYPRQALTVNPVMRVPIDAPPGTYETRLLGVPILAKDMTAGGHVNIGVGPNLIFTVSRPSVWQYAYFTFLAFMPWSGLGLALLAVLVGYLIWLLAYWQRTGARRRAQQVSPADASAETTPPAA